MPRRQSALLNRYSILVVGDSTVTTVTSCHLHFVAPSIASHTPRIVTSIQRAICDHRMLDIPNYIFYLPILCFLTAVPQTDGACLFRHFDRPKQFQHFQTISIVLIALSVCMSGDTRARVRESRTHTSKSRSVGRGFTAASCACAQHRSVHGGTRACASPRMYACVYRAHQALHLYRIHMFRVDIRAQHHLSFFLFLELSAS